MLGHGGAPSEVGGASKVLKTYHYGGTNKNSREYKENLDDQND